MVRGLLVLAAMLAACGAAQAQAIPRTADGKPDFHGVWESRWLTPFERLDGVSTPSVTGDAATKYAADRRVQYMTGSELHPDLDFDFAGLMPDANGGYRTSLIVSPATGKRPQTQLAKDLGPLNRKFRDAAENPEAMSSDERCLGAPGRAPLILTPDGMFRQIVQTPQHVVIYTEAQAMARVVGIDAGMRETGLSLLGDAGATWEGDTLVITTINIRPQPTPPGGPAYDQQRRVIERFTLLSADTIDYAYTLEDSAMLTEPLKVSYLLMRSTSTMYESACHEGNYGLANILRGARVMEERAAKAKK